MTDNEKFKDMIENSYLQQKRMIETNAPIMRNYSNMFGDNEIVSNIEKIKLNFLILNEKKNQ